MKRRKVIALFSIIIFLVQIVCYAEEEKTEIVLNDENIEQIYETIDENQEMNIYSEAAVLMEAKTGKVLYDKNMHERKYPASTTKILTAIIAIEKCDLSETQVASEEAIAALKDGYTKADIKVGESFTIEELLNVLILQSANEAANIIAEHISGSTLEFAKLMNEKAKEIGCMESNFVNPNGMHDENHYSSAYDLALIGRYAMQNETFRKLVVTKECSLPHTEFWGDEDVEEHGERNFKNTNQLLIEDSKYYYPYANGIKAGFTTPAKNCLVSSSNKDGFELIAVVLHAESTEDNLSARYVDSINLFEYGYNNYNKDEIYKEYNVDSTKVEIPTVESSTVPADTELLSDNNTEYEDDVKVIKIEYIGIGTGIAILIILLVIALFRKKESKH